MCVCVRGGAGGGVGKHLLSQGKAFQLNRGPCGNVKALRELHLDLGFVFAHHGCSEREDNQRSVGTRKRVINPTILALNDTCGVNP